MLRRGMVGMVCALTVAIAGCGSGNFEEAKKANEETVKSIEEIVVVLEGVKSPEDVNAAAARIDEVTNNLRATLTKVKDLKITKSEAEQLQQIQQERLSSLQGRMVAAAMKANTHSGDNPALAQALQRFQDMGQSFTTE